MNIDIEKDRSIGVLRSKILTSLIPHMCLRPDIEE